MNDLVISESLTQDRDSIEFPLHGQSFEIWAVVLPDCNEAPLIIHEFLDSTLADALHSFGGDISWMTQPYFSHSDIDMLNSPGLWKVNLTVFYSTDYEWETGYTETNLELCVDSVTLV